MRSMARKVVLLSFCLFLLLAFPSALPTLAEVQGTVVKVTGDEVRINLGEGKVAEGTELYVYRGGMEAGRVRVVRVEERYSTTRVLSSSQVRVGDLVTDQVMVTETPSDDASSFNYAAPPASGDPVKFYQNSLGKHSKIYFFGGKKKESLPGASSYGIGNIYSLFLPLQSLMISSSIKSSTDKALESTGISVGSGGSIGDSFSSFLLLGSLVDSFSTYQKLKGKAHTVRSSVEVIYWDSHLLDAYTLYYAHKEVTGSLGQIYQYRNTLENQFPVDLFHIFQIRIYNAGNAPLQFNPFAWHLYLIDREGRRFKALKYDPQLDEMVKGGETLEGLVYFPRTDPATGRELSGQEVRILLEDIEGHSTQLTFD